MMRKCLLFILCILCPVLYARDITFFCKPALHKSADHSISCVDFIYVINEKKNIDTFRNLKKSFSYYDIVPYRFDAVDPMKMSYKTLFNIGFNVEDRFFPGQEALMLSKTGKKSWMLHEYYMNQCHKTYFHTQMTIYGIAKNLSFLSVIFDAYKSKYDVAWIMTDEAKIVKNPNLLTGYICQINETYPDWDILYTDMESNEHRPLEFDRIAPPIRPDIDFENEDFYKARANGAYPIAKLGLRSGDYSFLISKRGMRKIINYYKMNKFFIPFAIEMQIIPKLRAFTLADEVVSN